MLKYRKFTDAQIKKLCDSIVIIIDKREKSTIMKDWCEANNVKYKMQTLSQGDYTFCLEMNEELDIHYDLYFHRDIVIERKNSLEEISVNFTKNRARFEEELSMFNGVMMVTICDTWDNLMKGNYNSDYDKKSFLATMMTFTHRYNIHFNFIDDKCFPNFVHKYFYYYLRSILKGEQ